MFVQSGFGAVDRHAERYLSELETIAENSSIRIFRADFLSTSMEKKFLHVDNVS